MESDWLNSITFYWSGCCQMYTHTSPSKRYSPLTLWAHLFLMFLGKFFPFWRQCCLPPHFLTSLALKQITSLLCSSAGTEEKKLQCVKSLCHAAILICINSFINSRKKKSTQSESKGKEMTTSRTPVTTYCSPSPASRNPESLRNLRNPENPPIALPYKLAKLEEIVHPHSIKFITWRVKWELVSCISQCS